MKRSIVPLVIVGFSHHLLAAELLVDPKSTTAPYHTIQAAIEAARPGDTIRVLPGVYRERLIVKKAGAEGQPILLKGEPGAILDGSSDVALNWQPAPEIAPGVFRTPLPFTPFTVTADGQIVTIIDEKRTDPALPHDARDNLRWPAMFKGGAGEAGWAGVVALTMYRAKEKDLLIKFRKNLNPEKMTITVAPKEPAILFTGGAGNWTIHGLAIRNAAFGVKVEGGEKIIVENCKIGPADYGVRLEGHSRDCIVRNCEIFMAPYSSANPWREGSWDNWQAVKNGGFYDRYAISASEARNCEFAHNYIHDHWDGIDTGWPGAPEANGGHKIHHNVLRMIFDDGMETSGGQADNRLHDNYLENIRTAIRIKSPTQGPLYIYRNIFVSNKTDMTLWNNGKEFTAAEVWIYQNTCTSDIGLGMNFPKGRGATSNYHVFNNLFWCLSSLLKRDANYADPDWDSDNNVFIAVTLDNPRPWKTESDGFDTANRQGKWEQSLAISQKVGIEKNSVWSISGQPGFVDVANRNMAVLESSPAFAAGRDLSKNEKPLPGCEANYFKGEKPNAGALQAGENMLTLPEFPPLKNPMGHISGPSSTTR